MSLNFALPCSVRPLAALLGAAILCGPTLGFGQAREPRTLSDLKTWPGPIVAEAAPTAGADDGQQAVTGYTVRRLSLPRPWTVSLAGRRTQVSEAFHVTLHFARRLSVRAQAFSLVIDGRWCGFLAESPDLRSADAVCFDPSLVRNGASLAATYRAVRIAPSDEADEVAPEADFEREGDDPLLRAVTPLQIREVR